MTGTAQVSSVSAGVTAPTVGALTPSLTSPLTLAISTITATAAGSVLIDFDAQVTNVQTNQNNTSLTNTATATYDNPAGGTQLTLSATAPAIKVGEPNLTMTKTIISGTTGSVAASTVRWQFTVVNGGNTTAYQQTITDQLPNHLDNISVVSVTLSGGNIQSNNAGCSSGTVVSTASAAIATTTNSNDTLTLANLCMVPGATLTVQYDSTVMNTAVATEVLTNTMRSTYASQSTGTSGTAVVRDGLDAGTDDDSFPSSGVCGVSAVKCNNYNESASQTLTIGAAIGIDKQADKTTASIGETVTYTIKVSVIEGVTPSVVVTDILPAGLTYVNHAITLGHVGMALGNASYNTRQGSGQSVQFTLGNIGNDHNADATDDFVSIAITARVDNILANQKGTILKNGEGSSAGQATPTVTVNYGSSPVVTLGYDYNTGTTGYQGRPLTITEPALKLTKSAAPTAQSLGDEVTFTLTIQHDGSNSDATAFDLAVSDTLPVGLTYVSNSTSPNEPTVSGQLLTFPTISSLTTAASSTTITYRAKVDSTAVVSVLLTNNATLTWKSQSGATGAASSGRSGPPNVSDSLNDYQSTSSASITPSAAAFISALKTVAIQSDAGTVSIADPGDTLRYTVTLKNTGGTTASHIVFTDALPANTTYAGNLTSSAGSASTIGSTPVSGISVAIGDMAAAATVTISFDVSINADTPVGTVISNQGSIDSDQTVPKPTDADGNPANGDQPTTIPVGGSGSGALYASKFVSLLTDADSSGTITAGDTMRYALIVKNTGGTALANVALSDPIPSGLTATGTPSASQGSIGATTTVTWTIGTLTAGQAVTAYFDVTINAFTGSPTFSNQGSVSATGVSTVQTDGNIDPLDGAQPTIFDAGSAAPKLDVQKRWVIAVDTAPFGVTSPGDTLQYTITVTNTGSAPATNVRLTDPLPACSGSLNPCTAYVVGSLSTSQGAIVSDSPQDVNIGTLAPGGFVTLSYSVLIDPSTANGVIISNQASVTRTGGGSVLSDDNGNPLDGINPTLTPISTTTGSSGYPSALAKQLVGSSETTSSGASVLIGEVLRYRISVALPKGSTRQVRLIDELPAGLAYLPGSARLARTFETGLSASSNPAGINSASTGVAVVLVDGASLFLGSGAGGSSTLDVFLGDVINSDADTTTPEIYTLEYRALVRNDAGNQAGTTLANAATVRFTTALGQAQSLTPVTATQTISEPAISLTKAAALAALPTTGGATEFTLNISNPTGANVAPAFDLVLSDLLPTVFASIGARSIVSSGATGVVDTTSGTSIGLTITQLSPGGSVSIKFTASAPGPLLAVPIVNNATLTWTSLPGDNGSVADGVATPGAAGSATGERIGTGGVNDYTQTATTTVTVPINGVAITKSLVNAQVRYAIGDPISYRVDITVPGAAYGPVPAVVVSDILAAGLTYVPGSLVIAYNGVSASTPPSDFVPTDNTPSTGQETLRASFGTLTNGNAGGATVSLSYRALVDNLLANQANSTLLNQASLTFTDTGSGSLSATRGPVATSITVGEPFLTLSKTLTSAAVGMMAGNLASFSVKVSNTGTTTAFETVLSDTLPTGLFLPAGSTVSVISSNLSGHLQVPTVSVSTSGWQTSAFDLPVGDSVTLIFAATLGTSVQPGQTLQNSVAATYSSRDGANANERNGTSSSALQSDDTKLNNYNLVASAAPLTVADPIAIAKSFYPSAALNRYAIGQLVTYRLTLSVLEGTTRSVRLVDTLPSGLSFVSADSPGTSPGTPITFTYSGLPTVAGQVVSFDLGDVVNRANGSSADDFITLDLTARVDNLAANQDGTVLGNALRVTFVDSAGAARSRDFDADAVTPGVQALNLTVLEPVLALTKKVDPAAQSIGDLVTFTLTAAHTVASHADAYNVSLTDTLPAGLAFEPGSVNPAGLFGAITGQALTFNIGTLAGASRTITYQARLRPSLAQGVVQTNIVQATWSSIPGATGATSSGRNGGGGLNDYTASAQASLVVLASIVGTVFNDTDANGLQGSGDAGLAGVTVTLKNANGAVLGTRTTATDGSYRFLGIAAGNYTVLEVDLSGYSSTTNNSLAITVPAGGVGIANFGDRTLMGALNGVVFNDVNSNGVQDAAELGISGVVVTLLNGATTATAANGGYGFANLTPGSYNVIETDPAGYASTTSNTLAVTVPAGGVGVANFGDLNILGSIAVNKTLYRNHSVGAGCPGGDEIVVVDAFKAPVKITWCFEVKNTGSAHISNIILTDLKLGITALNQALLVLRSGTLPLAPGAKATWYYEDTRTTSLQNAVTVTGTPSDSTGLPTGRPVIHASDDAAVFAYVFDPPFGLKTGRLLSGQPVIRWTMVWINGSPIIANGVVITDSPPAGTTYQGNLFCTPKGSTTVSQCSFEARSTAFPRGRVKVISNIGPDYGSATEATAANELLIGFDVTLDDATISRSYLNQGNSSWDPTGAGTPILGITDDPSINGVDNPTPVIVPGTSPAAGIPTLSEWGVIVLSALMGLFGLVQIRRRNG